jgi:hypothetical protein
MEVKEKAKKKKIKIGGERVLVKWYPVVIKKKSFSSPTAEWVQTVQGEPGAPPDVYEMELHTKMAKNAKGKLYITDTDVDVSQVLGKKKAKKPKFGDGKVDPAGSMVIDIALTVSQRTMGLNIWQEKLKMTWTTGSASMVVEKSKSSFEGMTFPDDDPTGALPTPFVGAPLVLPEGDEIGTGTLVSLAGAMYTKMIIGKIDVLKGQVWTMKITRAP